VVEHDTVQLVQQLEQPGLDLEIQGQTVALQGKGQRVVVGRAAQLQHRQERALARRGRRAQHGPEAFVAGGQRQHALILGEARAAVESVPMQNCVQWVEKGLQAHHRVGLALADAVVIHRVEPGDGPGIEP